MLVPKMYRIRQTFERPMVKDVAETVRSELRKLALEENIKPGQRVAITAGSRGIAEYRRDSEGNDRFPEIPWGPTVRLSGHGKPRRSNR